MRMLRTGVHLELLAHGATERVLGQHALDCMLQHALRMTLNGLVEGLGLESSGETAVAIVALVGALVARNADLVGVHDDDEVAGVDMRRVGGLVLTAKDMGGLGCNATEDHVLSVDEKPFALNLVGLCVIRLHF